MENCVSCTLSGSVATVVLNRPKALNALSLGVLNQLYETMDVLERDMSIKVVIITGAGQKAFIAGADIAEMYSLSPSEAQRFSRVGQRTMERIANMRPIVIAAINGYALGGGCELAMACDIRIASTKAKFGIPEVTLGVIPGFGGTQRLPRLVGLGRAKELLATGKLIQADEAYKIGLVNQLAEPDELLRVCMEKAQQISKNSTGAISLGKQAMTAGVETSLAHGLELESNLFALSFALPDQTEGMSAFLEKRPTQF